MTTNLGALEQVLLFAVLRLGEDAHGSAIRQEIEARTGRLISPGAVYTALDRLETRGLVRSAIGASTPERGGRRRKLYRLQPQGARALERSYSDLRAMASGLLSELAAIAAGKSK